MTMTKVKAKAKAKAGRDRYFDLIREFPLRLLRSNKDWGKATAIIDSLLRKDLDAGERDYLDVLTELVWRYEETECPMPAVSDAEMLRHLIEAKQVTQTEVAAATGIVNSTISTILSGARRPTRRQVGILASYFHVSPLVFSPE
jgi:HTH-type transcriptional regulator/antitoxin HigA